MEIFKLYEATIPTVALQPDHPKIKELRRDQLLNNYDEAVKTLQNLIRSKENEISYRRNLLDMLEKSKNFHDKNLQRARQTYIDLKKLAPESLDLKHLPSSSNSTNKIYGHSNQPGSSKVEGYQLSTTPPLPPPTQASVGMMGYGVEPQAVGSMQPPSTSTSQLNLTSSNNFNGNLAMSQQSSSSQKSLNDSLDIPLPTSSDQSIQENRSSLDRRLSEFLKSFPNLTQAGLAPPQSASANNAIAKPLPGYYTQHQSLPPPSTIQQHPPPPPPPTLVAATRPTMAMLQFPPPSLGQPPPMAQSNQLGSTNLDGHDMATDMDLSDYEDGTGGSSTTPNTNTPGIIPMVASAMQQGAGGKQHTTSQMSSPYATGYNYPVSYAPRLNALPFDPSIMDSRSSNSSAGSGGRADKHDKGGRYSGGSNSSGGSMKYGSDKNKYSSSPSSSSRKKRR